MFWISAQAVCTVLKVPFGTTAIAAIPVASACVILVVAITITFPFRDVTGGGTLGSRFVLRILACAGTTFQDLLRRAKMILRLFAFFRWTATVTAIKIAIGVIILRIAMPVGFVMSIAFFSFFQFRLLFRVQTFTLGAVKIVVILGGAAAVSTVPTTTAMVVFIITRFVSLPGSFVTRFAACNPLELRVSATALFTI